MSDTTPEHHQQTATSHRASESSESSFVSSSSSKDIVEMQQPTVFARQIPHNMSFSDLMAEEMALSNQTTVCVDAIKETKQKFDYKNLRPSHFKKIRLLGRGDGMLLFCE